MQLWYSTRNNQFWLFNLETQTSYFVAEKGNTGINEAALCTSVQIYWDELLEGLGWHDEDEFKYSQFIFESSEFDKVFSQIIRLKGYL